MLSKDSSLKSQLTNQIKDYISSDHKYNFMNEKQRNEFEAALKSLKKNKMDSHVYRAANYALAGGTQDNEVGKRFYKELKKRGYDGVRDINDKYLSGFDSKDPLIVFNKSKIKDISVKKLTEQQVNEAYNNVMKKKGNKEDLKALASIGSLFAASYFGSKGVKNVISTKQNDEIVREYKKKHPETKLSYNEIVRTYNNS